MNLVKVCTLLLVRVLDRGTHTLTQLKVRKNKHSKIVTYRDVSRMPATRSLTS